MAGVTDELTDPAHPTKVLYIGGYGRSGSTLLMRLLGRLPGFVAVGEMFDIWQRGFLDDQLCGCGERFHSCPFWTEVDRVAFSGFERFDAERVEALRKIVEGGPSVLRTTIGIASRQAVPGICTPRFAAAYREYRATCDALYQAVRQVSNAEVIVDSSKCATHALTVGRIPSIDMRVVHLVRDSRATAYSWARKKVRREVHWERRYMARYGLPRASAEWLVQNSLVSWLVTLGWPIVRIRYEDLVSWPSSVIDDVAAFAGNNNYTQKGLLDGNVVEVPLQHTIGGNAGLFGVGHLRVQEDDEWRTQMPLPRRLATTALTFPLLWRYGYIGARDAQSRSTRGRVVTTHSRLALKPPIFVSEVELSKPLPHVLPEMAASTSSYSSALLLIRIHGEPIGQMHLTIPRDGMERHGLASAIESKLHAEVRSHLDRDCLRVEACGPEGIARQGDPPCRRAYREVLADAPFASVVVATRDRPDVLQTCLDSLVKLEYPRYEVIVVDNAPSTEATGELLATRYGGDERVRYVREDIPGLSFARNRGLLAAGGKIVAFTDNDVVVDHEWLGRLAVGFASDPGVRCVTGLVLPLELDTAAQVWFEQFGGFGKGFVPKRFDLDLNRPASKVFPYAAGMYGSGNNMAFQRETLCELGGFDPALGAGAFVGGEDIDLLFRLVMAGYRLAYEPSAIVHHLHRRDYASLRRQLSDGGVVGLLSKYVLTHPRAAPLVIAKLPAGIAYAMAPHGGKNAKKGPGFPWKLTWAEWWGMLKAPWLYTRSRRRGLHLARQAARSAGSVSCTLESRSDSSTGRHTGAPPHDEEEGKHLRILFVAERYFPSVGGVEVHTYEVARRLADSGHEVSILTAKRSADWMDAENVANPAIRRVPMGPRIGQYYFPWRIYSTVRRGTYDIIHCQGAQGASAPLAMRAARNARIPYVVTFHSGGHSTRIGMFLAQMQWTVLRRLLGGAELLIGVSPFEVDRFRAITGFGRERFVVIPNGSDLPCPRPESSTASTTVIASIGRLERYKGHHRVLAAMPYVLERFPDTRLEIVGTGPYSSALTTLARRLSLSDRVDIHCIDGYDRSGMASLMSRATLVVLLSEYESQGLAVTEAIASGCRVLVSEATALNDLVQDGLAAGVYQGASPEEVARAIIAALESPAPDAPSSLPTWDECTTTLLAVYRSILASRVA